MFRSPNPKVIGAFVIGFALVGAAYTIANFGKPTMKQPALTIGSEAPPRVAIEVSDKDQNGVEDWRDEFVTTESVINATSTPFEFPTTHTGQLGINLLEGVLRARSAGPFGRSQEQVISDTVEGISQETAIKLYDTKDITVMRQWNEEDIKNYANAVGGAILNIKIEAKENELLILNDVMTRGQTERMAELVVIANGYKSLRDATLTIPVPALFLKQHLDLLNTYNALHHDISGMSQSFDDPVVALMSLKRYEDDARGLELALQNIHTALSPYYGLFSANDPATVFASFSSNRQQP
ncbi:MAG TPA: hypothetical protein VGE31_01300 [Candidatus Paceibacterota bacterium]